MRVSGSIKLLPEGINSSKYSIMLSSGSEMRAKTIVIPIKSDGTFSSEEDLSAQSFWFVSLSKSAEILRNFGSFEVEKLKSLDLSEVVVDKEDLNSPEFISLKVILTDGKAQVLPKHKLQIEQFLYTSNGQVSTNSMEINSNDQGEGLLKLIVQLSDAIRPKPTDPVGFKLFNPQGDLLKFSVLGKKSKSPESTLIKPTLSDLSSLDYLKVVKETNAVELLPIPVEKGFSTGKRVRGKVIDEQAETKISQAQIIISAKKTTTDLPEVITVINTDTSGNFSFPMPEDTYHTAFATVSIASQNQQNIILESDGRFPEFIWIVLKDINLTKENEDSKDEHCKCQDEVGRLPDMEDLLNDPAYAQDIGAACTNFTTPNRAIEEFTYYSVVRTSDPELFEEEIEYVEDRLKFVLQRIEALQNQLKSFSPFQVELVNFSPTLTTSSIPIKAESPASKSKREGVLDSSINSEGLNSLASSLFKLSESEKYLSNKIFNPNVSTLRKELAILQVEKNRLEKLLKKRGRIVLNGDCPIDWDDSDGSLGAVQAATIAYGHILYFKQVWKAAGYSLGDLVYSLPLAPGQKKQIVTLDWDWKEKASREESLDYRDNLMNSMIHDRDINEIVRANLAEGITASSHNRTKGNSFGVGAGYGQSSSAAGAGSYSGFSIIGAFTNMMGISGGYNKSSGESWSDASQSSFRNTSASSNQQLRDRTLQNASSLRSQRSQVVSTVGQNETFNVTAEVVANHNHCHAVTIQYFEVLRHFAIHQELSDVQECLFVPFIIESFNRKKVLRWKDILSTYLMAPSDKIISYRKGFDALQREENYLNGDPDAYHDFPQGKYCEEPLVDLSGTLKFNLFVVRPQHTLPQSTNPTVEEKRQAILDSFMNFGLFWWPDAPLVAEKLANLEASKIEENFQREILWTNLPEAYIKNTKVYAVLSSNSSRINLDMDISVISKRVNQDQIANNPKLNKRSGEFELVVSLRPTSNTMNIVQSLNRKDIKSILIENNRTLPLGSYTLLRSGSLEYSTNHYIGNIFRSNSLNNDLAQGDSALVFTPMNTDEQRNPRKEDANNSLALLQHLNSNKEYYHKLLWFLMDEQRLFNLLDKYFIDIPKLKYVTKIDTSGNAVYGIELDPNNQPVIIHEKRSVASVVELKRMGMAGNSMIFPVSRGNNLNEEFILIPQYDVITIQEGRTSVKVGVVTGESKLELIELYKPLPGTKHEPKPFRISVPTKGLFAESVMGACNSCEHMDDSRFWKWEEHPIDEPTAIAPVSTSSRVKDPQDLTTKDFPSPMINIQNAPSAPDPTGLNTALQLLGKSDLFKDLTGLTETQRNALQALLSNQDAAKGFADNAVKLATEAGKNTQHAADTVAAYDLAKGQQKLELLDKIKDLPLDSEAKSRLIEQAFGSLVNDDSNTASKMAETLPTPTEKDNKDLLTKTAAQAVADGKDVKATKTDASGNTETLEVKAGTTETGSQTSGTTGSASTQTQASIAKNISSDTQLLRYITSTKPKTVKDFIPRTANLEIGKIKPFDLDIKEDITWANILYIAGDNNLSDFALKDILEIQNGSVGKNFSTLCLFDLKDNNGLFLVEINDTKINLLERWTVNKDNDLEAIIVFIARSIASYSSAQVRLLGFWGHGSTAYMQKDTELDLRDLGLVPDDNTDARGLAKSILLFQLKNCIEQSLLFNKSSKKFNVIYFDCCLLQTAEIASEMSTFAEFQVASQEVVPGRGQNYQNWISSIITNNTLNADDISKNLVSSYSLEYKGGTGVQTETFSALDLLKTNELATKLGGLCTALTAKNDTDFKKFADLFYKAVNKTLHFPVKGTTPILPQSLTSPVQVTVDLKSLMINFKDEITASPDNDANIVAAIDEVGTTLDSLILANFADDSIDGNPAGEPIANGISIWYAKKDAIRNNLKTDMSIKNPKTEAEIIDKINSLTDSNKSHYPNIDFVKNSGWLDFLARFYKV